MTRMFGFSGNYSRPSRTRSLVEHAVRYLPEADAQHAVVHDVLDFGQDLAASFGRAGLPDRAEALLCQMERAQGLIIGAPVFKGSFPGLFKHVIDMLDPSALTDKPVLLLATGGGHRHALVVEHALRPLFAFFGARTMPFAVYAGGDDFVDGELIAPQVRERLAAASRQFAEAVKDARRHGRRERDVEECPDQARFAASPVPRCREAAISPLPVSLAAGSKPQ